MKKVFIYFLSAVLAFSSISMFIDPNEVSAGTKSQSVSPWKQDCKMTSTGKRCGQEYRDYTVTAKWTKSEVIKIANEGSKLTSNPYALASLFASYVHSPTGLSMAVLGMGANASLGAFTTAKARGTGLTWNYVYRITKGTSRGQIITSSWSYK